MVAIGTRRPRRGPRLCRRCPLHWRRNIPRLRQILRATNCYKLSDFHNLNAYHPDTAQPVATTEIHANHLEAFHTSLRRRCAAYRRRTNMYQ